MQTKSPAMQRRNFLKTVALAGVGTAAAGSAGIFQACSNPSAPSGEASQNVCPPILTQKRVLGSGNNRLEVSALSLGIMGMETGRGIHPDRTMMIKLIRDAFDRGVNFFDTAEGYAAGSNEELFGEAIAPFRDKVIIGTKFTVDLTANPPVNDNRPERIRAAVEGSLRRLKTDVIDLYYQHRIDRSVPIEDVAGAVGQLIKEGKVKHFGLSEVSAQTIRRAHAVCPVTAVQSEYHLMFRKPETEVFSAIRELGIGFVPYSPLNRGFLGDTLNEFSDMNTNDIRGSWPRFTPEALRANTRILAALHEFGKPRGMTTAQISLAWMMSKYDFLVPLFGTTKLSHLEEDLRAAEFALTPAEISEIETAVDKIGVMGDRYDAFQQSRVEY